MSPPPAIPTAFGYAEERYLTGILDIAAAHSACVQAADRALRDHLGIALDRETERCLTEYGAALLFLASRVGGAAIWRAVRLAEKVADPKYADLFRTDLAEPSRARHYARELFQDAGIESDFIG